MKVVLLWLGLSCGRKAPPPDLPLPTPPAADQVPERRVNVDAGGYWSEPGGLCLEVPENWSGWSGAPPHLLQLQHRDTQTQLDVFAWPEGAPEPPFGEQWVLEFADDDGYRTVPILSPAATATWRTKDPKGQTRTTWTGAIGARAVRVQATFAFGQSVQGLDEVEALLEALCTTFQ
ncbi:MAG: hypothetical protein AAGA48_10040 [Myxococcota bacterium]